LPLLRRAFSDFTGPERRQMGEKVRRLTPENGSTTHRKAPLNPTAQIDQTRARLVLPVLAHVLGVPFQPSSE
jgi:hypothetical protein